MWRQVALPVILVALSWLAVSGSTNFYLQWLDDSYQRAFDENISSMHAASLLQQELWRTHAEMLANASGNGDRTSRINDFQKRVSQHAAVLEQRATSAEERTATDRIRQLSEQYGQHLKDISEAEADRSSANFTSMQDQLFSLAAEISEQALRIQQVNDELLQSANRRRARISQVVLWARSLAITLVPGLGIVLGWWTANRLQRKVAQIQVTLHDPALEAPGDLGTVQVHGGDALGSIRQQVEVVVNRLRRTGEDLQAARQEVLRAERLAAIGGLAAGVAHELRNPLTSVKLLLQHAASRGNGEAMVAAPRMTLILDEIERMETTIQGLLDFSRPAEPHRKLHDLRATVERAVHLVEGRAQKQHVETDVVLGADPEFVNGDPLQLHQVFVNLLINAIEAMPEGGLLSVALHRDQTNDTDQTDDRLVVEISDTGDGIPTELLPRLFEPFASAKERGTGLGLAVSRRILQEHGGSISVRSRMPHGAIFRVTLPAAAAPASVVLETI